MTPVAALEVLSAYLADAKPVGGIFRMDTATATVLTDDHAKSQAGGAPRGALLLAATGRTDDGAFRIDADEQEVVLLRVRGVAPLPNERELLATRMEVVRSARANAVDLVDMADAATIDETQQCALDCDVIGTYYFDEVDRQVVLGPDVDDTISAARFQVFAPSSAALSLIASNSHTGNDKDRVEVGVVRVAATRRRAQRAGMASAPVTIDVNDIISKRTAVFGMTRTGKSNTIKTICTAVFRHAHVHSTKIGQVIFDPQGEYANLNQQDGTALRALGDANHVRIYRLGGSPDGDAQVFPLEMNFYDPANLEVVAGFVNAALTEKHGEVAYVKSFTSIEWGEPDAGKEQQRAFAHWSRARLGFYALLAGCGYPGRYSAFPAPGQTASGSPARRTSRTSRSSAPRSAPAGSLHFSWDAPRFEEFTVEHPDATVTQVNKRLYAASTPDDALRVINFMRKFGLDDPDGWRGSDGDESAVHAVMTALFDRISVKSEVRKLRGFHNEEADSRVEDDVWADMKAGRISIVDLSFGDEDVAKIVSERIANALLARANENFRAGVENVKMQVVVEEAHNLFERGKKEAAKNPWVRMSKEAAKYGMGLVYATQEISSVEKRILANTSNWFIAHLNSDDEIRELSRYYDFSFWADSLKSIEKQGFVRVKTFSNSFSVPVQIARFDIDMVNSARAAAGMAPRAGQGTTIFDDDMVA